MCNRSFIISLTHCNFSSLYFPFPVIRIQIGKLHSCFRESYPRNRIRNRNIYRFAKLQTCRLKLSSSQRYTFYSFYDLSRLNFSNNLFRSRNKRSYTDINFTVFHKGRILLRIFFNYTCRDHNFHFRKRHIFNNFVRLNLSKVFCGCRNRLI